jgi:saccharopine dehydrogenase-like NADP-dependent oxidoreductase
MLAATNDGRYMEHGEVYEVPGEDLFKHYWLKSVPGAGVFEAYVNRDALPYLKIYGIEDASGMYRGTLRNVGYCETWDFIKQLGLLNRKMKFDFDEVTPREVLANIVNCPEDQPAGGCGRTPQDPGALPDPQEIGVAGAAL